MKTPKKRGENFFEVTDKLSQNGKNHRLQRKFWRRYEEPCYWSVTRVKYSKVSEDGASVAMEIEMGMVMEMAQGDGKCVYVCMRVCSNSVFGDGNDSMDTTQKLGEF